jgi:hypothetical protein
MTVAAAELTQDEGALAVAPVELTGELPALRPESGVKGARLLVRLHGVPVGRVDATARNGMVDVAAAVRSALGGALGRSVFAALARIATESPPVSADPVAELWRRPPPRPVGSPLRLTVAV